MWKYNGSERPDFAREPGPGEESVWDYPRPPAISQDSRTIEVKWMEKTIALTTESVRVLETASPPTFYLPPKDLKTEFITKAPGSSYCEWKGRATYWNITVHGNVLEKAAWSYEDPTPPFRSIAGYFSFYPGKLECYVDNIRVEPQPGGFYGGWMTPEIVGPVKGEGGTGGW